MEGHRTHKEKDLNKREDKHKNVKLGLLLNFKGKLLKGMVSLEK